MGKIHSAIRRTHTHASHRIDDYPQALAAFQVLIPVRGLVAIDFFERSLPARASQSSFDFTSERFSLVRTPGSKNPGMHHDVTVRPVHHGAMAHPVDNSIGIRSA